jgi:hypothetical protein
MSREPQSPMMRGWSAFKEPAPLPPPPKKPRRRKFRVVVEPTRKEREQVTQKMTTTTEALTAEERRILRGYRLSVGGDAARLERMRIDLDIVKEKDQ